MVVGAIAQPLRRRNDSFKDIAEFLSRLPNVRLMASSSQESAFNL